MPERKMVHLLPHYFKLVHRLRLHQRESLRLRLRLRLHMCLQLQLQLHLHLYLQMSHHLMQVSQQREGGMGGIQSVLFTDHPTFSPTPSPPLPLCPRRACQKEKWFIYCRTISSLCIACACTSARVYAFAFACACTCACSCSCSCICTCTCRCLWLCTRACVV